MKSDLLRSSRPTASRPSAGPTQLGAPLGVAPHQPRVDWQMCFAALSRFEDEPWLENLCARLLQADAGVLALLERDPFQGRKPRYIRAVLYRYQFSDVEAGRGDSVWWRRERLGEYSPALARRH